MLAIPSRTLKDRAAAGALPHRRFGKHHRFRREDAETPFGTFAPECLTAIPPRLEPSTVAKYQSYLNNHLLPQWAAWPVIAIFNSYVEIEKWASELHEDYAESTVASIFAAFSSVMKAGVKERMIPRIRVAGFESPPARSRSNVSWPAPPRSCMQPCVCTRPGGDWRACTTADIAVTAGRQGARHGLTLNNVSTSHCRLTGPPQIIAYAPKGSQPVGVRVVDLRWLAPLPVTDLMHEARRTGRVLITDETRQHGGVSEAVVTALVDNGFTGPIRRVTSANSFIPLGKAANCVLLSEEDIEKTSAELLGIDQRS